MSTPDENSADHAESLPQTVNGTPSVPAPTTQGIDPLAVAIAETPIAEKAPAQAWTPDEFRRLFRRPA